MLKLCTPLFIFFFSLVLQAQKTPIDAATELKTQQRLLQTQISAMGLKEPTNELLNFSWKRMRQYLYARKDMIQKARSIVAITNLFIDSEFENLLEQTFIRLITQHKIKYMNSEMWDRFHLQDYVCNPKYLNEHQIKVSECRRLRAFYVHLVDTIFIRSDLPQEQFSQTLFHELIHAYQMAYRFPIDLAQIQKFVKAGRIQENQIWDLISFTYEAQANWYEIVGTENADWSAIAKTPDQLKKFEKNVFQMLIETVKLPAYAVSELANGSRRRSMPQEDDLLAKIPFVDHPGEDYGFNYGSPIKTAFVLREPLVLRQTDPHLIGTFDMALHQKFSKALEHLYFGELPFLFQELADDQLLFKEMNDEVYRRLYLEVHRDVSALYGRNNPITDYFQKGTSVASAKCAELVQSVSSSDSPFVFWLTTDLNQNKSCASYLNLFDDETQSLFLNRFLKRENESPFLMGHGTEGAGGGFELLPTAQFLPQFELLPERSSP